MLGRARLVLWCAALAAAVVLLLRDAPWPSASGDPALAVMAVVRLVAGVLAVYLLVATVLAVRVPRLAPRFARRLVAAIVGGSLLLGPVAASAATSAPPPGVEAPVLHRVEEPTITSTSTTVVAPPGPVPEPARAQSVVVRPGDHLWAIAERAVAARLGREPTDAEVIPYWEQLMELNRDQLPDVDLIFPEQVLRLPS